MRRLNKLGYVVVPGAIPDRLRTELTMGVSSISGVGTRRLLDNPIVSDTAEALRRGPLRTLLQNFVAVQCTGFFKTASDNWAVRRHRDRVVVVKSAIGWEGVGEKEGLNCARPPLEHMAQLLAVRLHLDSAHEGDLEVIPGSHRVDSNADSGPTLVSVPQCGALVMRPLLLHGSKKLQVSTKRRVLHYLFAPGNLGVQWYYAA
ncbi:MAG: hypothetical protein AAF438_05685 [Pseudomonadota bacterium]